MSVKKAEALMRSLKEKLAFRFPGFILAESKDANENPVLSISDGTPATGEQNAVIRIKPIDAHGVNVLGMAQEMFSPHQLQIAVEESALIAGASFLSAANSAKIISEAAKTGVKVELYMRATGAIPTTADMIAANKIAEIDDIQWQLSGI